MDQIFFLIYRENCFKKEQIHVPCVHRLRSSFVSLIRSSNQQCSNVYVLQQSQNSTQQIRYRDSYSLARPRRADSTVDCKGMVMARRGAKAGLHCRSTLSLCTVFALLPFSADTLIFIKFLIFINILFYYNRIHTNIIIKNMLAQDSSNEFN